MTDDLEVRLEIGMAEAVDKARVEKDAWKEVRDHMDEWGIPGADEYHKKVFANIRQLSEEHFLYWQREEEMRRKALRHWRKEDE